MEYHRILKRQIRKSLGRNPKILNGLNGLLELINNTYNHFDDDRKLLERSMELSSDELIESNIQLRQKQKDLEQAYEELLTTQTKLEETEVVASLSSQLQKVNDELYEQKEKLTKAYSDILAAQESAKRIQMALIGEKESLTQHFKEAFIFYKPLGSVSGDFYWYAQIQDLKIVVAADCTGHGVSGAFMTIMGCNFLDDIVNGHQITNPSEILYILDLKFIKSLQSKVKEDLKVHDGMDLAIMTVNEKNKTVYFSGAKNPLYMIRDGQLETFKGSRFPVGSTQYRSFKNFETHAINYQEGDIFYIFTDGFQDQFGGERSKKYQRKKFREKLLSINHLPLDKQKSLLKEEFHQWKGDNFQTDDVLVLGIKF